MVPSVAEFICLVDDLTGRARHELELLSVQSTVRDSVEGLYNVPSTRTH